MVRLIDNLIGRIHGPMGFRFILQPTMAILYAIWDGHKDARAGKPPYFWALFTNPEHRREMIRDGWKSVGKIFILAVVLDVVYQLIVLRWLYPAETLLVALFLAIVPYAIVRGPVNRMFRLRSPRK